MAEGVRYIKVSKIDGNGIDNSNALAILTELTIPWSSGNVTYDILNITEYPSYFLYYVENPNIDHSDKANLFYNLSGSLGNTIVPISGSTGIDGAGNQPIVRKLRFGVNVSGSDDNLDFLEAIGSGVDDNIYGYTKYRIRTYPQKNIHVRAVGSVTLKRNTSDNHIFQLVKSNSVNGGVVDTLAAQTLSGASAIDFDLSAIINSSSLVPNDEITLSIANSTSPFYQAVSASFSSNSGNGLGPIVIISSSLATGSNPEVILEPYFSEDFASSLDCQPLLNNAIINSVNSQFQEVDYNDGMFIPSNQQLILNNQAARAQVQDSNYTLLRHTNPRYNGSRSTSQFLNTWSSDNTIPGYKDVGTFGKIPSVSTLRTMAAYCSIISGYTPELMNASAVVIKYLIDEDGSLITPNQSPNSLEDNKNTFLSGERIKINVPTTAGSTETQYRTILHGGKRIEPILYTQLGHSPAAFTSSINLTTDFVTSTAVGDYQAISIPAADITYFLNQSTPSGLNFNNNLSIGADATAWSTNTYTVDGDLIQEGVSLSFEIKMTVKYNHNVILWDQNHAISLYLYKEDVSGNIVTLDSYYKSSYLGQQPYSDWNFNVSDPVLSATLNSQDMSPGDKIYVSGHHVCSTPVSNDMYYENASFKVFQSPIPTNTVITSSGTNTIWGYPDNTKLYAITCSNDPLTSLYDFDFFQEDLPNSGFNKITIPWSIKYGDEFRFEGNEDFSHMVKKVYDINDTDSERVSNTGSIEVQFGSPGKSTGGNGINDLIASESINLDHFLIRRYVDDSSVYIIQGFKPTLATGNAPLITIPEYSTQLLNENLSDAIRKLEEDGLGFPIS